MEIRRKAKSKQEHWDGTFLFFLFRFLFEPFLYIHFFSASPIVQKVNNKGKKRITVDFYCMTVSFSFPSLIECIESHKYLVVRPAFRSSLFFIFLYIFSFCRFLYFGFFFVFHFFVPFILSFSATFLRFFFSFFCFRIEYFIAFYHCKMKNKMLLM